MSNKALYLKLFALPPIRQGEPADVYEREIGQLAAIQEALLQDYKTLTSVSKRERDIILDFNIWDCQNSFQKINDRINARLEHVIACVDAMQQSKQSVKEVKHTSKILSAEANRVELKRYSAHMSEMQKGLTAYKAHFIEMKLKTLIEDMQSAQKQGLMQSSVRQAFLERISRLQMASHKLTDNLAKSLNEVSEDIHPKKEETEVDFKQRQQKVRQRKVALKQRIITLKSDCDSSLLHWERVLSPNDNKQTLRINASKVIAILETAKYLEDTAAPMNKEQLLQEISTLSSIEQANDILKNAIYLPEESLKDVTQAAAQRVENSGDEVSQTLYDQLNQAATLRSVTFKLRACFNSNREGTLDVNITDIFDTTSKKEIREANKCIETLLRTEPNIELKTHLQKMQESLSQIDNMKEFHFECREMVKAYSELSLPFLSDMCQVASHSNFNNFCQALSPENRDQVKQAFKLIVNIEDAVSKFSQKQKSLLINTLDMTNSADIARLRDMYQQEYANIVELATQANTLLTQLKWIDKDHKDQEVFKEFLLNHFPDNESAKQLVVQTNLFDQILIRATQRLCSMGTYDFHKKPEKYNFMAESASEAMQAQKDLFLEVNRTPQDVGVLSEMQDVYSELIRSHKKRSKLDAVKRVDYIDTSIDNLIGKNRLSQGSRVVAQRMGIAKLNAKKLGDKSLDQSILTEDSDVSDKLRSLSKAQAKIYNAQERLAVTMASAQSKTHYSALQQEQKRLNYIMTSISSAQESLMMASRGLKIMQNKIDSTKAGSKKRDEKSKKYSSEIIKLKKFHATLSNSIDAYLHEVHVRTLPNIEQNIRIHSNISAQSKLKKITNREIRMVLAARPALLRSISENDISIYNRIRYASNEERQVLNKLRPAAGHNNMLWDQFVRRVDNACMNTKQFKAIENRVLRKVLMYNAGPGTAKFNILLAEFNRFDQVFKYETFRKYGYKITPKQVQRINAEQTRLANVALCNNDALLKFFAVNRKLRIKTNAKGELSSKSRKAINRLNQALLTKKSNKFISKQLSILTDGELNAAKSPYTEGVSLLDAIQRDYKLARIGKANIKGRKAEYQAVHAIQHEMHNVMSELVDIEDFLVKQQDTMTPYERSREGIRKRIQVTNKNKRGVSRLMNTAYINVMGAIDYLFSTRDTNRVEKHSNNNTAVHKLKLYNDVTDRLVGLHIQIERTKLPLIKKHKHLKNLKHQLIKGLENDPKNKKLRSKYKKIMNELEISREELESTDALIQKCESLYAQAVEYSGQINKLEKNISKEDRKKVHAAHYNRQFQSPKERFDVEISMGFGAKKCYYNLNNTDKQSGDVPIQIKDFLADSLWEKKQGKNVKMLIRGKDTKAVSNIIAYAKQNLHIDIQSCSNQTLNRNMDKLPERFVQAYQDKTSAAHKKANPAA